MYSLTPAFIFLIIFPNPVQRDVNNRLCITTWLDKSTQGSHWSLDVYKSDFPITPMMKSQITIIVLIQGLMIFPSPENCLIVLNRWRPPQKKWQTYITFWDQCPIVLFFRFTQIFGFLVLSNRILVFIYVTNLRVEHVEVWDSLWEFQPSLVKGLEEVAASPRSNLAISGRRELLLDTYNKYSQ